MILYCIVTGLETKQQPTKKKNGKINKQMFADYTNGKEEKVNNLLKVASNSKSQTH